MTKTEDFIKICRACNNEKANLLNLFAVDSENEPTLGEKFASCTSLIVLKSDKMPQQICYSCAKLLEEAYKFNRMCHNTEQDLRRQLPKTKIGSDDEDEGECDENFCEIETLDSPMNEDLDEEINLPPPKKTIKEDFSTNFEILENEDIPQVQKKVTSISSCEDPATSEDRQFICDECDKKFFTSKALDLHTKVHHKRTTIKPKVQMASKVKRQSSLDECTACDLLFGSRDEYRDHKRIYHSKVKNDNNICEICGKRLRNKIAFKNHMRVHDTENRPFPCNVCGKQYTEYRYLYRHMVYHSSTLFRCTENSCNRTYTVKHKFVDHLRRHHEKFLTNSDVRQMQPEKLNNDDDDDVHESATES